MLGIIGGTGLYNLDGFTVQDKVNLDTPFGPHSGPVALGTLAGRQIAFLPRHGEKHQFLPSEVNYRANIWILKKLGVRSILGVSAVGSLIHEIRPGEFATPTQYLDFTRGKREQTFFGKQLVGHISSAKPVCPHLHAKVLKIADIKSESANAVYACVEGPRLGTRAESLFLKSTGATVVGMTNIPEVFLAREAQICYQTLAVSTDYDSWLEDPSQHATTAAIIESYKKNLLRVQGLLPSLVEEYQTDQDCSCRHSLDYAVLTSESEMTPSHKSLLEVLKI